jgi:hypothetical protein
LAVQTVCLLLLMLAKRLKRYFQQPAVVNKEISPYIQPFYLTCWELLSFRLMRCWKKVWEIKELEFLFC